jgi:hypothetical protein
MGKLGSEFQPRPGMEANSIDSSANTSDSEATQEADRWLGARESGVSRDNNEMTSALLRRDSPNRFRKESSLRLVIASCVAQQRQYHSAFRMGDVS